MSIPETHVSDDLADIPERPDHHTTRLPLVPIYRDGQSHAVFISSDPNSWESPFYLSMRTTSMFSPHANKIIAEAGGEMSLDEAKRLRDILDAHIARFEEKTNEPSETNTTSTVILERRVQDTNEENARS